MEVVDYEGEGSFDPDDQWTAQQSSSSPSEPDPADSHSFAPHSQPPRVKTHNLPPLQLKRRQRSKSTLTRTHHAWSTAWNSRLGRVDNAKFIEHFRYIIVASQLLDEYLDHGAFNPSSTSPPVPIPASLPAFGIDGAADELSTPTAAASIYGAAATAVAALALVYLIRWTRTRQDSFWSKSRVALALAGLLVVAFVGYQYGRRQWLRSLRRQAVGTASDLTSSWQAFELSSSSSICFIQEVELVSKGYRLSTPLPPASRIEESGTLRRCIKLRNALHKAYASIIPSCIEACVTLRSLIEEDDLEKYFDIYDISHQDAKDASAADTLNVFEDDPESLKSLRVMGYRASVLRRVTLCSLLALEADGGKPDIHRWQIATDIMRNLSEIVTASSERVRLNLSDMEQFNVPITPIRNSHAPAKEKMRSQVRKISALSSGIRGLQAKMQVLREETNRSIEQSEDLTDLGPNLIAQYDSIGIDLRELVQAWETGKQSLQSNITRHERRISMASSGLRSPVSSLGGLTAVEEFDGSPADALKVLNGDLLSKSNRSSLHTSDEEMVFEAVAMPRKRASTLTRGERIVKMQEERDRQALIRAQRDANTSMLRELETVINLRPKKTPNGATRITSI